MKKLFCLLMCCVLLFLMFGCSGEPVEETSETTNEFSEEYSIMPSDIVTSSSENDETQTTSSKKPATNRPADTPANPQGGGQNTPVDDVIILDDPMGYEPYSLKEYYLSTYNVKSVEIIEEYNDTVSEGSIIRQTPAGGTPIKKSDLKNTVITLYISKGKYIELPQIPYTIKDKETGLPIMTILNLEIDGGRIDFVFRNDSDYSGTCWIHYTNYDKDGMVTDSAVVSQYLNPGETGKVSGLVEWDAKKITIDDSRCHVQKNG